MLKILLSWFTIKNIIEFILITGSLTGALFNASAKRSSRLFSFILWIIVDFFWIFYFYYYYANIASMILFGIYLGISFNGIRNNLKKKENSL